MDARILVYSDGGARGNPGPAAIGIVICDPKGKIIKEHGRYIGKKTNNIAEYSAVIESLEKASELGAKNVSIFLDSKLVASQLMDEYRIKKPHLKKLFLKVRKLEKRFESVSYTHVPRTNRMIKKADRIVNLVLDGRL